jgi:predicted esterase
VGTERRDRFEVIVLWLALATAACVLEPSKRGALRAVVEVRAQAQVPDATPTSWVADQAIRLDKRLDGIAIQAHFERLPVDGFPDAVLAEPLDTAGPRPVVVVLHGLGDRPEPHCEAWRVITGARAFILCPRGAYDAARSRVGAPRYTHASDALRAHVDAALVSLANRYGSLADTTRPLLSGFSLGAWQAAVLAQQDGNRFSRVALVEGGLDLWLEQNIHAFVSQGGRRVLFGCGSWWCTPSAQAAATRMDDAGLGVRLAEASVGHHDAPELVAAMKAHFLWFVDGDERWLGSDNVR